MYWRLQPSTTWSARSGSPRSGPARHTPALLGWLLVAAAGAPTPAGAQPAPDPDPPELATPDGLDAASQRFYAEAEAAHDPGRAAGLYRLVLSRDPGYLPASLGLARALLANHDRAGAERVYRGLGTEPDAVEGLALLVEEERPEEALRLWKMLETLRLGDPTPYLHEARLYATRDVDAALAAWSSYRTLMMGAEPEGRVLLAVTGALVDAGREGEAEGILRAYIDAFPEGTAATEARARLDRMEVERAAGALVLGGAEALTVEQQRRRVAAAQALAAGRWSEAAAGARELVAAAPRSDAAHGLYADVLSAGGDPTGAEVQAVLARSLAPDVAEHRIRLAQLLTDGYGGRRDAEALEELREAVALRPGEPVILHRLGVIEQGLGQYERAAQAFEAQLRASGDGEEAIDARRRLEQLRRQPPQSEPPPTDRPLALDPAAASRYRIALVYLGRGQTSAARAELDAALNIAPRAPLLLNLRARLLREGGDLGGAERTLAESLAADPAQGAVYFALGELALSRGEEARAELLLRDAADHGEPDAHYLLARMYARRADWSRVRTEISAYQQGASRGSPYAEGARGLGIEAARRQWVPRLVAAGVIGLLLGGPLAWELRRRTARTLRDLLDGAPECWHEAARTLSALRHEVLKHNTTVLPDIAAALERGDEGAWHTFRDHAPAVLARFETYVDALEALGRRHGFRVDLRRRDPVVGPMYRALRRLAGRGWARLRRTPPDPRQLRGWSTIINERGYGELGRMVQEICILPVTAALLREVYARVAAEPGFSGAPVPPLEVEGTGGIVCQVRMFRADLDDILANLYRNALAAGTRTIGVILGEAVDPITGQPWVELKVRDDAPGTLTNAMIRGRYIGRGLGLAVDLLNRHGGTIHVEPDGERKSVVVQLPAVEAAQVEVEWSA